MKYLIMLVAVIVVAVGSWFLLDRYNRQLAEVIERADSLQLEIENQKARADSSHLVADSLGQVNDSLEAVFVASMENMEDEREELREDVDSLSREIVNMIPDSILQREIEVRLIEVNQVHQARIQVLEDRLADANNLIMERNREIRSRITASLEDERIINMQEQQIADLREALRPKGFWASLTGDIKGNTIKAAGTIVVYEGLKALVGG